MVDYYLKSTQKWKLHWWLTTLLGSKLKFHLIFRDETVTWSVSCHFLFLLTSRHGLSHHLSHKHNKHREFVLLNENNLCRLEVLPSVLVAAVLMFSLLLRTTAMWLWPFLNWFSISYSGQFSPTLLTKRNIINQIHIIFCLLTLY